MDETKRIERKRWWSNTTSNLVGTVIGIIITFGVGFWVEQHKRAKDRDLTTLMIAGNAIEDANYLILICDVAVDNAPYVERLASLTEEEARSLPEDSIKILMKAFSQPGTNFNDFGRNLLNTNLDILRSTDNYKFLFFIEECFNYFDNIKDFINKSGPKSVAYKINEILSQKAIEQHVEETDDRWDIVECAKSYEIKNYLSEYLNIFIPSARSFSQILKDDTLPKIYDIGKVEPEKLKEIYNFLDTEEHQKRYKRDKTSN